MQSTIYVEMALGVTIDDLYQQLGNSYKVYLLKIQILEADATKLSL